MYSRALEMYEIFIITSNTQSKSLP